MEKTEWKVYMRSVKKDYAAIGRFDGKGVIVLKGSRVCADWKINSNRLLEQRRHYVDITRVLIKDLYFASPSQASMFVCGRSSNGWVMWRFENGDVLDSFREKRETDIQEKKNESWQLQTDGQKNDGIRMMIEGILSQIQTCYREVTFQSKKIHTSIYLYGECIAIVYYRKSEIRIEVRKNESMLQMYNRLFSQNLVYQKPTADPNSVPGKYCFFVAENAAENVLWALIYHQRTLKKEQAFVTDTKLEIAAVDQVHKRNEMYSPERNERESIEKNDADTRKHAQHSALNIERIASEKPSEDVWIAELFRQVAQLQEVVLQQKKTRTIAEQSVEDNRYRIAAHRADSPEVFVHNYEKPIQNLTFSRDFFSKDDEKKASRFQAFFMDEQHDVVSNIVEFNMESGQTIRCRFTLKSKMSGKKVCFLGIRDSRDLHDELLKLIPFRIEILFNADFDL